MRSFWDEDDARTSEPLVGSARAQVAIVGGGFAGLSAAYHLKLERPELDVVLVEAGRSGSGASGRSTGMLGPGVGGTILDLRRRFGDDGARAAFQATLDAVARVAAIVERERLDCDLELSGQLLVALTDGQARGLAAQARCYAELGFDVPFLDRDSLQGTIRVPAYRGGLRFAAAGLLDPVKLCRELARVVVARGVRLHEGTPVRAVERGRLVLERGEVVADQIVVAANAAASRLGLLRGRVVPLHTHVVVTEPLGERARAALGWRGREGVVDARRFFDFFRLTPDDRVLMGGGRPLYRDALEAVEESTFTRVVRELRALLPALQDVPIAHRWAGSRGFTLDRLPVVGELVEAPGVIYAGAWCGHGVALATASGAHVADLVARRARRPVPWERGSAPWLPPDPLRAAGLHAYLAGLDLADRLSGATVPEPAAPAPEPETVTTGASPS